MGLPVRFAAPDSQCQGWGRVNSGMPVRITLQPEKLSDSLKVQAFGITPASGIENPFTAFRFDGQSSIV